MVSEATHQRSRGRKPRKPSISSKDSILTNPTLPQEIIAAILVRLPVKYLLPFKCVSKDWLALISRPDFVKSHLRFSAKDYTRHRLLISCVNDLSKPSLRYCNVSSLFYKSVIETFDLEHPVKPPNGCYYVVVGSENGLICFGIGFGALVIWNPYMRKFKKLPVTPKQTYKFGPMYGFGYDDVHDDYKVVIMSSESDGKCDTYIFSLKSYSWRRIEDFQGGVSSYWCSAALMNGKLHWVTKGGDGPGIISFDLVDEKWKKMDPPCSSVGGSSLMLASLGGDFCALDNILKTHCDLWVMKEYGVKESWTKLYTIKYHSVNFLHFKPLYMSNEGELLLRFDSTLAVYNPKDDSIRYPEVTDVRGNRVDQLYTESLVCPILQDKPRTQQATVFCCRIWWLMSK